MTFLKVFLLFLSLVLLPGCDTAQRVSGEIIEYHADAQDNLTGLTIRTDKGETLTLVPAEDEAYRIFSWLGADTIAEIREKLPDAVLVSAQHSGKKSTLTEPDGTQIPAYVADWVMDTAYLGIRNAYTFSDGITADLWNDWSRHSYRLNDRTELLRVDGHGPENVLVGDTDSFDSLSPEAQEQILSFYHELGLLYDETAELEKAYAFYKADPENFQSLWAGQDISPYYANDHIFSLITTVTLPLSPGHIEQVRLCHTFDRNTGEPISNYDLFTAPPVEVIRTLLELGNSQYWDEPPVVEEVAAALKPEYIQLSDDYLSIDFPAGTYREQGYGFGFPHTPETWELLQPWAKSTP